MPNPNPRRENLISFPANDRPISDKVTGTRHYEEVHRQLQAMNSEARQRFIRDSVEAALAGRAPAEGGLDLEAAIAEVLPTIPIRDRAIAAKAFKKLVAHLERVN